MRSFFQALEDRVPKIKRRLRAKGIQTSFLNFGGPGSVNVGKPRVPTDAQSEFLVHRAMGDWAEKKVAEAISQKNYSWKVVPYGNTNEKAAGEPGFKEMYLNDLEETRLYGKRPDLLIFDRNSVVPDDLSKFPQRESDPTVVAALGAIEVRSSKFDALTYMKVRGQQKAAGKKGCKDAPSFTVKIEDLKIVYRWMERHDLPQIYAQVFFDSIYAINMSQIFEYIAETEKLSIENPNKSQNKATIMIPITYGEQIGFCREKPTLVPRERVTELGRHDFYAIPTNGFFDLDVDKLKTVLYS